SSGPGPRIPSTRRRGAPQTVINRLPTRKPPPPLIAATVPSTSGGAKLSTSGANRTLVNAAQKLIGTKISNSSRSPGRAALERQAARGEEYRQVDLPDLQVPAPGQQRHRQRAQSGATVAAEHHPAAIPAVDQRPGQRRDQHVRQRRTESDQGKFGGRAGALE